MILRRLGGGDEAYCTYVEEADDGANKNSTLIEKWYKRFVWTFCRFQVKYFS